MYAIQAARMSPASSSFGTIAVTDATELDRELRLFENRVRVHPAERDFGGRDQIQVAIVNAINLCLWSAGMKPVPCRISVRAKSGVIVGVKPALGQVQHGELLQCQFKQDGVVLEEVKPIAGDFGTSLEVDHVSNSDRVAHDPAE